MVTVAIVIVAIALLLVFAGLIVRGVRTSRFKPTGDKRRQQEKLNADLKETGFAYELREDYFYSLMECWQREVGYCRLYDEGAPLFNMIIDSEPITFYYGGKRWLIELWKGQYGITTGAEIGIYNTAREDIDTPAFRGTFYENIRDDERMELSFVLYKNGRVLLKRSAIHWWLTAFKLGEYSDLDTLTMDTSIQFPNREMCRAFENSLIEMGYQKKEYRVRGKKVDIHFTKPHSKQPETRNKIQEGIVQKINESNCRLYETVTGKYGDTLDKLEYLKAAMPEVFELFVASLYARGVYKAFDWIRDIIFGFKPPEPPEPPCNCLDSWNCDDGCCGRKRVNPCPPRCADESNCKWKQGYDEKK